jgi:hypothetical protein
MNKIITLISLCLFCTVPLFSQIDPFSDFKIKVATERSTNLYFAAVNDSIDITTQFEAACNPLNTIKSKWTFQEKKLFYQEKDSFSYTMVGNILRPESKTFSIWRFDKQEWVGQTRHSFNYPNNSPNFVERITSSFDTLKRQWIKRTAESFLLDKKGNTLDYENYDPYGTSKKLYHKIAYEYTTWGALTYLKSERPSNGDWRTDSIKTITFDTYRNRTATTLTTYIYDKLDNQLSENMQKDSVFNTYKNGLLIHRKIADKSPLIDSFFYNYQNVLILKKSFYTDLLGNIDTSKVNLSHYEDLNGKSLIQKNVYKRIIKSYNATTKKDTSYWVISFSELFTLNALNQISSIRYIASDPQFDYSTLYSKVVYKYCGDISLPSTEIYENLSFTINPNPTNHTLFINAHEEKDLNGVIQIVDVLGNIIRSEKINNLREIDVSNLSNGIYFLKIQVDKSIGVKKFIVQH